jgi:type IV pilus secretin PilQ/predicted competence protein
MWWCTRKSSTRLAGILSMLLLATALTVLAQPTSDPSAPIENLQFQGAELRSVLSFLADYGNVNVVISPDVVGSVTIRLQNVKWRDAMDIIGRTYDLAVVDEAGGYIRIMTAEAYRDEMMKESQHTANQLKLVPLETKIVKIANSTAEDMVQTVQSLLTERGKCVADTRSNSLVIQEVPENMPTVLNYITELDKPARQIKISAQLLEISSEGLQELGLSWVATGATQSTNGKRKATQTGTLSGDLESISGTAPVGSYNVKVTAPGWNLNATVEAIVKSGKGKIVAHPEISTVENKEARIQMGQKVPVKQFDESGNVVIKFEEIGTILVVTPHITAENQVLMHLKPERSTYEFDANGVIINTNNAETNVIVNNGQTAVIGGLTTQDEVETEYGVPLLKDIPLLGRLFKYTQKKTESRDLVIFVTPTIAQELAKN